MSKIIPFNFDNLAIRVVTGGDGEPLFVGKDICDALGYADHTNAIKQHCRGVVKRHPIADSLGRKQDTRILLEPDVMRLILGSALPSAQRFEAWVFEEVLPSIRKTGAYLVHGVTLESMSTALASQIGGIVKAVTTKSNQEYEERLTARFALALAGVQQDFDSRFKEVMAGHHTSLRYGKTAGQIWRDYGLEALKGAAGWFSRRLVDLNCQIDGCGKSESGGIPSKLFDPDRVAIAMKGGLLQFCRQYAQQRKGQGSLFPPKKAG